MANSQVKTHENDENTIYVTEHRIACDGGGGAGGHPKTYYELGASGEATCNYCGQKFVLKH